MNGLDEISAKIVCAHEIEANYFAAELLIPDDVFLSLADFDYTYEQIACELGVHTELAIIKGKLLNNKGYKLNIPYVGSVNYLGSSSIGNFSMVAEDSNVYEV